MVVRIHQPLPTLAIGVIGNIADSDSVVLGSSPRSPAIKKRSELNHVYRMVVYGLTHRKDDGSSFLIERQE